MDCQGALNATCFDAKTIFYSEIKFQWFIIIHSHFLGLHFYIVDIVCLLKICGFSLSLQEPIMFEFECHYREEKWQTARYFDFVKTFLLAAQNREDSDDCTPLPCPTTPYQAEEYLKGSCVCLFFLSLSLFCETWCHRQCSSGRHAIIKNTAAHRADVMNDDHRDNVDWSLISDEATRLKPRQTLNHWQRPGQTDLLFHAFQNHLP